MGAKYDIVGGIVSKEAMAQLREVEKLANAIGASLSGIKLSNIGKEGLSKTQEKLVADLERANKKMEDLKKTHSLKIEQIEAEMNSKLLSQKQKHDQAMAESEAKAKNALIKEREKLNAKLFELELKINSEAAKNREKFENDTLKSQQDFNNKLIIEKQKLQSKIEELDAKELARQKDYEKRRADTLADRAAREAAALANKKVPLTPEQKVANSNTAAILKLNAIAADANSTSLQKLGAQMRLLEIEMQAKFNPALADQSQEFRNLNAEHARLQQEYQRTARATGVMGRSMNSTYGSTFQLTQVMRELPNFAIDARVGFMALSNNLPMLADSFKILKQQIIDTEGAAGATMKTWKVFAKSLLSLNTIMIVASTLLVLFGDDIVKFGEKLFASDKIINKASESIKALIAVTKDYSGAAASSISSITRLGIEINKYGSNAEYADTIVEKFNDTFNTHLTSIDQVKAAYPEMAKAAIDAAVKTQAAMSLIQRSSTALLQKMEAEQKLSGYKKSTLAPYEDMVNRLFGIADEEGLDKNEITTRLVEGRSPFDTFLGQNVFKKEENRDIAEWFENPNNLWFAKYIAQQRKANKVMELLNKEASKLIQPPKVDTDNPNNPNAKTVIREVAAEMKKLSAIDPKTLMFDTPESPTAPLPNVGMLDPNALEDWLNKEADAYERGLQSYADYQKKKEIILDSANARNIDFTDDTNKRLGEIELNRSQSQIEIAQMTIDAISEMWSTYFDYMNEKIEEQLEIETRKNDESIKDAEDRKDAGIMTEKELSDFKERMVVYQQSVEDEAARKKEENDRKAFLLSQSFAAAQIWLEYAKAQQAIIFAGQSFLVGAPAYIASSSALNLASAIAGTSIILAQSIPAFEQGGVVAKDGTILAGEKRHELAILPDGSFFVTANKPTLYDVPKGTEILPDLNKIDIMDILHLKPLYANHSEDKQLIREMQNVTRAIKTQKQGNFYGMPLIKQLDNRGRFDSRRKSLMN